MARPAGPAASNTPRTDTNKRGSDTLPRPLPMPQIDTARFLADLHDLRKIGTFKTGVHRPTYSPEDMESRRWLMARMAELMPLPRSISVSS